MARVHQGIYSISDTLLHVLTLLMCNFNRYLCYELYNLSWVVFLFFLLQTDDFPELGKMFRQYIAREGDPFILDIDLDFFRDK
jgi:hypothetical protein